MPRVLIGSIADMRVSISFAALLVKVTARTPPGLTLPVWMSHAIRVVRTRVLPEPAPARISADWSGSVTAASCSGLRFSRRLCIRAFPNARFYPTPRARSLRADFVLVLGETGVPLQVRGDGFGVLFGFEIRQAYAVDALLLEFLRSDLGRVSGLSHLVVDVQRLGELLAGRDRDFPFTSAAGHAPPRLRFGLRRPRPELIREHGGDRPRHGSLEGIEGHRLAQGQRALVGRRNLDAARDQADDLALRSGFPPEVRASHCDVHGIHRDTHLALAREFLQRPRRKPESPLGDENGRLEDAVTPNTHAIEEKRALLAELHRTAVRKFQDYAGPGAGVDPVAVVQLRPRRERGDDATALDRCGGLNQLDGSERRGAG